MILETGRERSSGFILYEYQYYSSIIHKMTMVASTSGSQGDGGSKNADSSSESECSVRAAYGHAEAGMF